MIPKSAIKPGSSFWEVNDSRFPDVDVAVGDPLGEKFVNLEDGSPVVGLRSPSGAWSTTYVERIWSYDLAVSMLEDSLEVRAYMSSPEGVAAAARVSEESDARRAAFAAKNAAFSCAQSPHLPDEESRTAEAHALTIPLLPGNRESQGMRTSQQIQADNQEIDLRIAARKAYEKELRRESRRQLIKDLPRYALAIAAYLLFAWLVKSCESPNNRYDEDRTGIKGMPN